MPEAFLLYSGVLFTPLWYWGLRRELEARLVGATVVGGRQMPAGLVVSLQRLEEAFDLAFWLDPDFPRVECLARRAQTDLPERWSALLQAELLAVRQPNQDRRLDLEFAAAKGTLLLEYFGFTRPAVRLTCSGALDSAQATLGAAIPEKLDVSRPFLLDAARSETTPADDLETLSKSVRGLDRFWIEAAERNTDDSQAAWRFMRERVRDLESGAPRAYIVWKGQRPSGISLSDLSPWLPEHRFEPAESLSRASANFVFHRRRWAGLRNERKAVLAAATDLRKRLRRRHKELMADRERQEQHPLWTENADWLTSQLSHVHQGQTELRVPTADGERVVPLDPAQKPHEQAQAWYQTARRLRRGLATTQRRLDETKTGLDALVARVRDVEERIDEEDEASQAAWGALAILVKIKPRRRSVHVDVQPVRFRRFKSPGGLAIWVGRNNQENDELTLHHAHKNDLWFHAQQTAGSHVVLRSHALNQPPSHTDIEVAAAAAAFFSRARTSSKAPVIYTLAKYVRKPRGAAPGKVMVEREKSIMVEPALPPPWDEDEDR